jgi:4-amino-4-deoxy-L-arabinose transferase-like glycosyltransferase
MFLQAHSITIILFLNSLIITLAAFALVWSKGSAKVPALGNHIDWCEAIFVTVVSVVVFVGWIGVILASIGLFSLVALSIALLLTSGAILWYGRPYAFRFLRPGLHEIALIILLIGCSIAFFRPHEYILGGCDAGTYMNIGAAIARTGSLVIRDDWTRFLANYASVTLREQPAGWLTRYLQFVGWYINDTDPSELIPQFFPFHPVLIAVGISLAGLYGGLLVTPLWGVLSIAAVYFVGRRLFGAKVGLLAAILLAVTPTQIWFARYPTAEPLTLLLVFSGLLAFQRLWDDSDAGAIWGVFGGATLGAAFLTRIDLPLVAILVIGAMVIRWRQKCWSRSWSAYACTLGLFTAHALLSARFINWPYVWNTYQGVFRMLILSPTLLIMGGTLGLLVLVAAGITIWQRGQSYTHHGVKRRISSPAFRWLLAGGVILLSAYGYFVRPLLEPVRYATSWPSGNQFPILNGQNWVRIGWYLTPLGLMLATLGLAVILWQHPLRRLGLFLSVGVITTIQYVHNIMNTPYHIYTMRRYVPIVIPMLMIYAAVAIVTIRQMQRVRTGRIVSTVLALGLIAGMGYQARFVVQQRDFYSAVQQIAALNAHLKPDAIIIISEPAESLFADTFGVPLQFIFGHDIATIRQDNQETVVFIHELQKYAREMHRPVQLIAVNPVMPVVRESLPLRPLGMFPVTLRMLMNTFYDYPSVIQTVYYGIEIYEVVDQRPSMSGLIDIGGMDTLFIREGFYDKEYLPGSPTMRWTASEALLDIPLTPGTPITVEVRAMIYRPAGVPPADVVVILDGEEIGRFTPDEIWRTFVFRGRVQSPNGMSQLRFKTSTFNPARLNISGDQRDLGFLIDWINIKP